MSTDIFSSHNLGFGEESYWRLVMKTRAAVKHNQTHRTQTIRSELAEKVTSATAQKPSLNELHKQLQKLTLCSSLLQTVHHPKRCHGNDPIDGDLLSPVALTCTAVTARPGLVPLPQANLRERDDYTALPSWACVGGKGHSEAVLPWLFMF
jgi:hypothetical protein